MDKETVKYLVEFYLHLVPLEVKANLKYPYLSQQELETENLKIAEVIMHDFRDKIFLNYCPNCGKLARTPNAKQCRFCCNDWHD